MPVAEIAMRPYEDSDEERVLECLVASLGGGPAGRRPPEFFRWKHLSNPFGRSYILLAESGGRIAGVRAFMRWRFRAGDRHVSAVRAVDTATHPDFQGAGIFTKLTLAALDGLREEGTDLVFNTPNANSLPGYLKMGWTTIGRVPIWVRIQRPVRFAIRFRSDDGDPGSVPAVHAPRAWEVLRGSEVEPLLDESAVDDQRLHTVRSPAYLRWRYGEAPLLDYHAVLERAHDGLPRGIAIFRVRPRGALWEATLSELIVRPGDRASARALMRRVRHATNADHVASHFPAGSPQRIAARLTASVRVPGGIAFVTNPLKTGIMPDPSALESWALSVGDLEVF